MRNFFLLVFVTHCLGVFAQDDSIDIKFAPTLTDLGKPVGEKLSQKIDKDGGKLVSPDGRMELIIPQDALSKKTNISIQPVINTLSPGKGSAYQLEPSGVTLQKPLQVIFHYSQKESPGELPDLRGIAWQDDKVNGLPLMALLSIQQQERLPGILLTSVPGCFLIILILNQLQRD